MAPAGLDILRRWLKDLWQDDPAATICSLLAIAAIAAMTGFSLAVCVDDLLLYGW